MIIHQEDCKVECGICREILPVEEMHPNDYDFGNIYKDCVPMCSGWCGEYIDDTTVVTCGPEVMYRDPSMNGKLRQAHAVCAAEMLIAHMDVDDKLDDVVTATREQIAEVVAL